MGSRRSWYIILIFSGITAFVFRNEAIRWMQSELLKNLHDKAVVCNHAFLQDSSVSQHLIYTLKGTERIWPHRVNSLRRLKYLYPDFSGFECDIRFDAPSGGLCIGHDPADVTGTLTFSDYLRSDPGHKLFWLDVKNLSRANIKAFCDRLQQLDQQYDIRRRLVIESYDTASAVRIGELGYLNAFNVSDIAVGRSDAAGHPDATDPAPASGKGYNAAYMEAIDRLMPRKIKILSGDTRTLPFIKTNFPGRKLITWDIRFLDGMNRDILLRYANDTSLLICLINVKSPGYR